MKSGHKRRGKFNNKLFRLKGSKRKDESSLIPSATDSSTHPSGEIRLFVSQNNNLDVISSISGSKASRHNASAEKLGYTDEEYKEQRIMYPIKFDFHHIISILGNIRSVYNQSDAAKEYMRENGIMDGFTVSEWKLSLFCHIQKRKNQ
jgi:hypothetical protein